MNSFGIDRIMKMLPHRFPFLLVDKVLETEGGTHLVAIKNVTINEPFFQGHFPEYPVMPGVLQIEMIAQAAGLMVLSAMEEGMADFDTILMSVEGAKFRRLVQPGDQLRVETKLISRRRTMAKVSGVVTADGEVTTEATMMFLLVPKTARSAEAAAAKPTV